MIRMPVDQRDALIAEAPDVYYLKPHYEPYPCVLVRLVEGAPRRAARPAARRVAAGVGQRRHARPAPRARDAQARAPAGAR